MTSNQLPLGLRFPAHQCFEGYEPGGNAAEVAAFRHAIDAAAAPWVFLAGPEGSGKTHLLIAACQQAASERSTRYLPLARLGESAEAALMATQDGFELLCIDELDALAGHRGAEIALFDLYNRARARSATLVFAARQPPSRLPLVLPDLRSRLSACTQLALRPLSDEARRAVLKTRAAQRGFTLDDSVVEFLFRRFPRDTGALIELLDRLDRESLAAQRRITVPFLRRVMGLPSRRDPPS